MTGFMNGFLIKVAVTILALAPVPAPEVQAPDPWESLGSCRITEYCPGCNEPYGYGSASGKRLEEGDAACAWLPLGTEIRIDGETYTVVDVCGTDAIDLFVDTPDGCRCNLNEEREVEVKW